MKNYIPDIRLPSEFSQKAASNHLEKFGGLPVGFPQAQWPMCKSCGKPFSFIAQLQHHPERLDLGKEGRVLYVFMCTQEYNTCGSWEPRGANACIILDKEDLQHEASELPSNKVLLIGEVIISDWIVKEDGIEISELKDVYDDEYDESVLSKVSSHTRLGGIPFWIQGPEELPKGDWKFAGQMSSQYEFVKHQVSHYVDGPNFGDCGMGYIFIKDHSEKSPKACFFWQCY